jgi:hypothetical protein
MNKAMKIFVLYNDHLYQFVDGSCRHECAIAKLCGLDKCSSRSNSICKTCLGVANAHESPGWHMVEVKDG